MDPLDLNREWVREMFKFMNSTSPVVHIYVDPKISLSYSRHFSVCRSNGETLFLVSYFFLWIVNFVNW